MTKRATDITPNSQEVKQGALQFEGSMKSTGGYCLKERKEN